MRVPAVVLLIIELLVFLILMIAVRAAWSVVPSIPLADPDTWGYLKPALTWLSGLGFQQTDGRDWLYPALLAFFLKSTGSFAGIVLWQRSLGVLASMLMAITWRTWVSMLPFNRWILFLISLTGILPIFVQLVNQQSIVFEMAIRPEAVLPFFVYAQFACLMGYCKYRWQTPKALPSVFLGAAAVILAYACLLLKPSWLGAFAATSFPVFAGISGRALPFRTKLLPIVLGIASSFLILWLPSKVLVIADSQSRTLLPDALFCVHAPLIDQFLTAKCAALADSDPEKAKLQGLLTVLEKEITAAENLPHTYEKLGFDPDYLMHSGQFTTAIYNYAGNDREKFRSFCISSWLGAVRRDPETYVQKVLGQFTHFLFPQPGTFFTDHVALANLYRESVEAMASHSAASFRPDLRAMFRQYQENLTVQADRAPTLETKAELRIVRRDFAFLGLPLELLFLLTLLTSLIWHPLRSLRTSGWAALFLFLGPLGNAITVCLVHALDVSRYCLTYGGYLLFALTAMTIFVCAVLVRSLVYALENFRGTQRNAIP